MNKIKLKYAKYFKKAGQLLNNRRGNGTLIAIIFTTILVIAVLASAPTVQALFASVINKFSTFINAKLDALFS